MLLEKLSIKKCDELKHIIIGIDDCGDVFPKLKELEVRDCENLEYIFGHYSLDNQNREDINLHLPSLRRFIAEKLFNFIGICSDNYWITLPPLTLFELSECPKYSKKSIGDFFDRLDSRHIKVCTYFHIYIYIYILFVKFVVNYKTSIGNVNLPMIYR